MGSLLILNPDAKGLPPGLPHPQCCLPSPSALPLCRVCALERELGAPTRKARGGGSLLLPGWPGEGQTGLPQWVSRVGIPQWVSSTERNLGAWGPASSVPTQPGCTVALSSQPGCTVGSSGRQRQGRQMVTGVFLSNLKNTKERVR